MDTNPIRPDRSPLLPDRLEQADFFICDIFDAAPKADRASMEHPIFSLSTKPDLRKRRYENGQYFVEVIPSVEGLATVHDRDVLIFCISQVMAALNQGRKVTKRVRFTASDLLRATNRANDGRSYEALKSALVRLRGTTITTNIETGGQERTLGFGLIEAFEIIRKRRDGRMIEVEVTLSDWVFNAIEAAEVLTLHRDYFRLRKPLERRLYEIGRKHCGAKLRWPLGMEKLKLKCGSGSTDREFRRLVQKIVEDDAAHAHMPEYRITIEGENLVWHSRKAEAASHATRSLVALAAEDYEDARNEAPGWDIYYLEDEWRLWLAENDIEPRNPGRNFVKFSGSWFKNHGPPR